MRSRLSNNRNPQSGLRRGLLRARLQRAGAAAVEFAIVLPVLVTILLGATDFGRISYSTIALTNAARCGAEYASMNPYDVTTLTAWTTAVNQAVKNELSQTAGFDATKLVVTVTTVLESGGLRRTTCQVTYPFTTIFHWPSIPSSINLQKTAVMRGIR